MPEDNFIVIGKIISLHGIKGWVSLKSFATEEQNILNYKLHIKKTEKFSPIFIEDYSIMPKKIIIKIKDINSIESAEKIIKKNVYLDSSQLEKTENGEYYWYHLIGCDVISENKKVLGKVKDIMRNTSSDVLILEDKKNHKEILIPFVKKHLLDVDIHERIIKVVWENDF